MRPRACRAPRPAADVGAGNPRQRQAGYDARGCGGYRYVRRMAGSSRMLDEEPHHFRCRVRSPRIGVGTLGLPPNQACPAPWTSHCSTTVPPACVQEQRPCVGVAAWNLPGLHPRTRRAAADCLRNDSVAVAWVDCGIPVAVENDGRNDAPGPAGDRSRPHRAASPRTLIAYPAPPHTPAPSGRRSPRTDPDRRRP